MTHKIFADLMAKLIAKLGLTLPDNLNQDTCIIAYQQQPDIHFVNNNPEFIDVICHVGTLGHAMPSEQFINLFALNSFKYDEPQVAVTVHPPTGTVSLLSRQSIQWVSVASLLQLIEVIYLKNEMIREIVTT